MKNHRWKLQKNCAKASRTSNKANDDKVVEICRKHEWVLGEIITASGDTVLHKIVSQGKEDIVEKLMDIITEENLQESNIKGNNLLHMAAAAGSEMMCKLFNDKNPELVNSRNKDNETPLHFAVLYGRKEVLHCLHGISSWSSNQEHDCLCFSRRKNGNTILHDAIAGDHFELALMIIRLHKELASCRDEHGFTPLHVLATKPTAFKSGYRHAWNIVYYFPATNGNSQGERQEKKVTDEENPCRDGSKSKEEESQIISWIKDHFSIITFMAKFILTFGSLKKIKKIEKEKQKHRNATKVLEELVKISASHKYYATGGQPLKLEESEIIEIKEEKEKHTYKVKVLEELSEISATDENYETREDRDNETVPVLTLTCKSSKDTRIVRREKSPILLAAEKGIEEVVEKIIEDIPMAIDDMDSKGKNVVLLAAENMQILIYDLLLKKVTKSDLFHKIDDEGNTALHHAAKLTQYDGEINPTLIMEREIQWYKHIASSMPPDKIKCLNKEGKTAKEVFTDAHKELIKEASEEVNKIANSCSVVATLVATVAFATATTKPGGPEHHPSFILFAITSLLALLTSMISLITFLSILFLTTRHTRKDFGKRLRSRILWGVVWLLLSLAFIFLSYCSSHFFLLNDLLKTYFSIPIYGFLCGAITVFTVIRFLKSSVYLNYPYRRLIANAIRKFFW
ncbi:hypothetical protein F0562_017279 [Nyssa sinensis]|uniref:PGG domain-containing protein n=1 Tax=Nyssa sinensis TaxID=561372 RepID=A0A5J4ZE60_9ASTE|nr:hypothetical protein F0562_017279 [Nyssa sinensis]